jgi:hypothetical protein
MVTLALMTLGSTCLGLCVGPLMGRSIGLLYVNIFYYEQIKWATGKIRCGTIVEHFANAFQVLGGFAGMILPAIYLSSV